MATTRIKDISKTTTDLASDTYGVFDGATNGTQKMARNDMYADWAAAYTAAPTTYKLAPLNSGTNKIDATYLPTSGDTPKGEWNASTNSPSLADGSGTAGDYYDVTTGGTQNLGSGPIDFTVGDVVKYNGSTWFKIDSVANILDGSATAADGRSALSVNSIDEDAEATGTKLVGPALYFRGAGPNDYLEVADDDKLSFTDGTDDLPFAISFWIKPDDVSVGSIISKNSSSTNIEWVAQFASGGKVRLGLYVNGGTSNYIRCYTDSALSEGQLYHILFTYSGSGDATGINVYVNGDLSNGTRDEVGTYTGMSNTSSVLRIGHSSTGGYFKGHIRDVKIFNRELTAAEVAELARGNDLGFAEEWGDNVTRNTGTFTNTVSVSSQFGTITGASANGFTAAYDPGNSTNRIGSLLSAATSSRKRYRVTFDADTGGQTVQVWTMSSDSLGGQHQIASINSVIPTRYTYEFVEGSLNGGDRIGFLAASPSAGSLVVSNLRFTAIGILIDFRAENYDSDTGKIYDLSDNAFVGTSANLPTLTGRAYPVYETGTWTPSVTFGGGSTGITYSQQEGNYTRIGQIVYVSGYFVLTAKGSSTGTAKINGLPITAVNLGAQTETLSISRTVNMAGLTSVITGNVDDNATSVTLYDHGATGSVALTEANFTDTSVLRFSGTYQIQ